MGRAFGEIGESALLELAVLAVGFAQEDGGWRVSVEDALDSMGMPERNQINNCKLNSNNTTIYMATNTNTNTNTIENVALN